MDKFYKSLLIPILEPRIEKAIAEAIQDGKCILLITTWGSVLMSFAPNKHTGKPLPCTEKEINLYGSYQRRYVHTLGQEALIYDNYRNYKAGTN